MKVRNGFTLIELVVVPGVAAIIVGFISLVGGSVFAAVRLLE